MPVEISQNDTNFAKDQELCLDVFNMITFLEKYEMNLRKSKQELYKMLSQDSF